jgi:hypothetical protein
MVVIKYLPNKNKYFFKRLNKRERKVIFYFAIVCVCVCVCIFQIRVKQEMSKRG